MSEVREHEIYKFLTKNGEKMRIDDVVNALGRNEETKQSIWERILTMARYGLVTIKGEFVVIRKTV